MSSREEFLAHLWADVINIHLRPAGLTQVIAQARQRPDDPLADSGPALERLLALGADLRDICLLMRNTAYESVFSTLYALGDPGVDDNEVFMLHEDLLSADPSGMEGRPGSASWVE